MRMLLLVLLITPMVASAEIYKWTDEAGKVHFSDKPFKGSETVEVNVNEVGSLVTPETKKRMMRSKPARSSSYAPRSADRKAGASRACTFSKNILKEKELKLNRLRQRGYKQYERADAEDAIDLWQQKVITNCN